MGNFRNSVNGAGYNQEEAFFYQKDKELIEKGRVKAARPKLTLIKGGKEEDLPSLPVGKPKKVG